MKIAKLIESGIKVKFRQAPTLSSVSSKSKGRIHHFFLLCTPPSCSKNPFLYPLKVIYQDWKRTTGRKSARQQQMSTPTAKALAAFGDTSGGSEGSPTSRKSPTAKAKLDTGAIANPMMKMLSVKVLGNIKMKAKKIKRKAVGIGHKPYRTRLQIIDPADSKTWLTAYLTFKNYKLTCHHTSLVKKSSGTGVTYKEWVVGKLIVELNCEQSARITILPSNVKEFACKVETEKRSVYIACSNEVLRNRLLRGLQPVCTMTSYAGAPTPNPICAFCGRKGCEKYVPRTDVSLLPAPFASVSDKVCEGCWRENDETRRREVTANVVDVRRKPGSLLHR